MGVMDEMASAVPASSCRAPEDVFRVVQQACRGFGRLSRIQFMCRRHAPEEVVCFIDMEGSPAEAARAMNGIVFGGDSMYLAVQLHEDFRCPARRDGAMEQPGCNACHMQLWQPGAAGAVEEKAQPGPFWAAAAVQPG